MTVPLDPPPPPPMIGVEVTGMFTAGPAEIRVQRMPPGPDGQALYAVVCVTPQSIQTQIWPQKNWREFCEKQLQEMTGIEVAPASILRPDFPRS